jgi:hypothetical protein
MRTFLLLVAACSPEPRPPDEPPLEDVELPPLGTFCFTLDTVEQCSMDVTASHTLDAGALSFRIDVKRMLPVTNDGMTVPTTSSLRIDGGIVPDVVLPARAASSLIAVPVIAGCHRVVQIDPFGSCAMRTAELVCKLDALGSEAEVLVHTFDETHVAGTFHGSLQLDKRGCCASTPSCANPMEQIDSVPTEIRGRFSLAF